MRSLYTFFGNTIKQFDRFGEENLSQTVAM